MGRFYLGLVLGAAVPRPLPMLGPMTKASGSYTLLHHSRSGTSRLTFCNLVTDEGLGVMLRAATDPGASAPIWYMGLKGGGDPSASDTAASHPGWQEVTGYTAGTRPAAQVSIDGLSGKTQSVLFSINSETTVCGAFLSSSAVKGGAQGALLSVGDFQAPRILYPGDRLELHYSFNVSR